MSDRHRHYLPQWQSCWDLWAVCLLLWADQSNTSMWLMRLLQQQEKGVVAPVCSQWHTFYLWNTAYRLNVSISYTQCHCLSIPWPIEPETVYRCHSNQGNKHRHASRAQCFLCKDPTDFLLSAATRPWLEGPYRDPTNGPTVGGCFVT